MRPCALVLLTLLLCLAPTVPAQEKSGSNAEDTVRRAQELLDLSVRQNSESHALAMQTAQQALVLWQAAGDRDGIARTYAQIARCFLVQSDLMEATKTYEKVLQLWRELHNTKQEASTLIKLGFIEVRKGEWSAAIALLTQAEGLVDEEDVTQMGQIAVGLATIFNESGLPENGLIQLRRAVDYYRQTPDERDDKRMVLELGNTYYLLGNPIEALAYLKQALASFDPDTLDAAQSHEYLGRVYGSLGEHAIALQHLQSAVPIYERIGNPQEAAQTRGLMGQTYQQQGRLELARRYYQQALVTFRALSDQLNQSAIHYALGRLELKHGNYDAAEDHLRQSIAETENLRRVSTSRDLTAAFSATVHERYSGYIECLMHKHQAKPSQGLDVLAFELSELARARSLAELLRTTQTNLVPGLDPELAKQEKLLRQSLKVKEDSRVTLLARNYPKEDLQALDAELARLEREYEQVTDIIRAQYPSYRQVTRPDTWDLRQIQEHVVADDQTVLLEYSLGADQSYVWAVTHNSIKSYELPSQARINEAAQKVYQLLTTTEAARSGDELSQATRELGQMVLSPVAAELNKPRMIVVADGALHYIPFQILPASSTSDQPLVATTEVINAPSASILGQLRRETTRRQAPEKLIAAFGDPIFASNYGQRKDSSAGQYTASPSGENGGWRHTVRDIEPEGDTFDPSNIQPLFYTRRELANLRNAAGPETFMATGFDATREQLESMDLAKYAILHFATHGILNPKRPENSGFFLSMVNREGQERNGFIRLQDVYALRAPVDLVVLSACRTGLGKDVRGEGLIGLTRGFMYAGASSVVASLWRVDDEATAELMKRFYTNMLQGGMTPSAALRSAQNSIRREPHWNSPYFWAAFTLQGEFRHVIKAKPAGAMSPSTTIILAGALVVLLAVMGWSYRRDLKLRTRAPDTAIRQ